MWYSGLNNSSLSYILYATSTDGINWIRPVSYPVLSPSTDPQSWDGQSVNSCTVIFDNGVYKMYYTGWSNQYESWHIGLATSVEWHNVGKSIMDLSCLDQRAGKVR